MKHLENIHTAIKKKEIDIVLNKEKYITLERLIHLEEVPTFLSKNVRLSKTPKSSKNRYKRYNVSDLLSALWEVGGGLSALSVSRKYNIPARTLYDKARKLGISGRTRI